MTLADALLALTWLGVTAYTLFGGADFGAGFWDLLAGGRETGWPMRRLIEKTLGPIWEANHVWLIFVLVVLWTAFPAAFAAITSTLIVPLTLAAVGIIFRGAAFAFRKEMPTLGQKELFGAAFALSSVVTPFFLGATAGAVASGRVPPGNAQGDLLTSWWNPTGITTGVWGVGLCAYLAVVYLTREAQRDQASAALVERLRRRALVTGAVMGALAIAGLLVIRADAPVLWAGFRARGWPLALLSGLAGLTSLLLLARRRFVLARATSALAVAAVIWGWAAAQYPHLLLGSLTIQQAAAPEVTLRAMLISLLAGSFLLVPSLVYLFLLFQRAGKPHAPDET